MATGSYNRIQPSATGDKAPYPMSHPNSSRCCFTARGDWAILTNSIHDTLARIQFDCGALLNVKALCLSLLPLPAFTSGWIIRSQCVSLPRLLFLLCQAGALPGLSLRFVNFCLVHLETNIREHTKLKTAQTQGGGGAGTPCFHSVIFPGRHVLGIVVYTVKSRCLLFPNLEDENLMWVQTTRLITQIFIFNHLVNSLSVYLTPVDFDCIRKKHS